MRLCIKIVLLVFLILPEIHARVEIRVKEQDSQHLVLSVRSNLRSEGDLVPKYINVGLPSPALPTVNVEYSNETPLPFKSPENQVPGVRWAGNQIHQGLYTGALAIVPWTGRNTYFADILITIEFPDPKRRPTQVTNTQRKILSPKIINWETAADWVIPRKKPVPRKGTVSGSWYNFKIHADGVYQITGDQLLELASIFSTVDPKRLKLFTGSLHGRAQSDIYNVPLSENLSEVTFEFIGEDNGVIDPEDRLLFYGYGPDGYDISGQKVNFHNNLFFNENNYWLLIPDDPALMGNRLAEPTSPVEDGLSISRGYRMLRIESDLINPFQSGLAWVGEPIGNQSSMAVDLELSPVSPTGNAVISYRFLGGSSSSEIDTRMQHLVSIHLGSSQGDPITNTLVWYGQNYKSGSITIPGTELTDSNQRLIFKNQSANAASEPYLDYLDIRYEAELVHEGQPLDFYPPSNVGGIFNVNIESNADLTVWDITDPFNPLPQDASFSSGIVYFKTVLSVDTLRKYIAFNMDNIQAVSDIQFSRLSHFNKYRNSTLSAEHILLGPEEFRDAGQPLIEHRENSIFVDVESVYREFAGGNKDPLAIRNFLQWTQENWQSPAPYALFIMGDADFDYRNISGESRILVPTIEKGTTSSYASDDFLATIYGPLPEVAIGRIPAQTAEDVITYIDKLILFETSPETGIWRQKVTLVADDPARPEPRYGSIFVGKSHTRNSETLADLIPPTVGVKKFYLLEYPEVSDASSYGVIKPAATEDLFRVLKNGTAIINYIGHGSANQWAQEKLLVQDRDLPLIETGMKLPIWIAGTCSWGHFDAIGTAAFAEDLILMPMNGASGIITTTRPISVSGNAQYVTDLFEAFFPDGQVSNLPLGILLQSIKTPYRESRYFQLFGDPLMPLTIPSDTLSFTSISPDTLVTLGTGQFSGIQKLSSTGGTGYVIIQDADQTVTREYNIASSVESLTYTLPGGELFRGRIDVTEEGFSGDVRIPKDISYSERPGHIKMYFVTNDDPPREALGYRSGIYFKGGSSVEDQNGPIITLETADGRSLRTGDHIFNTDDVLIRLQDPLGINTAQDIGHEILITDVSSGYQTDLTELFSYDANSITAGTIPLPDLGQKDKYHFSVKAWDAANNPNEKEFIIYREEKKDLKLFQVYNFPNPFSSETRFQFEITQPAEISIDIFTTNGRKIYSADTQSFSAGTHFIAWNGLDEYGDEIANGVYLYRIRARGESRSVSHLGQVAKFR